jgi:outer membrane protein assembly factor BamB
MTGQSTLVVSGDALLVFAGAVLYYVLRNGGWEYSAGGDDPGPGVDPRNPQAGEAVRFDVDPNGEDIGACGWAFDGDSATGATGRAVNSSPTVAAGSVFVGNDDGTVYAVGATSSEQEWVLETGGRVGSSPTVVGGTVLSEATTAPCTRWRG